MAVVSTNELKNDSEELIKILGDRIEEIERTLHDDEDFCNQDIDATYQAALKYIQSVEENFSKKLDELKDKLDRTREENLNLSKQNKKQFDDEIEEINQLFSSGKHQEALEKFNDYEKRFEKRSTIIEKIPKLQMNEIDVNQYLSFDIKLNTPLPSLMTINTSNGNNQNSFNNVKQMIQEPSRSQKIIENEDDNANEHEFIKSFPIVRPKRLENQPIPTNHNAINNETKPSLTTTAPRPFSFSTRLSKNLTVSERDVVARSSVQNTNQYSRGKVTSHTQTRLMPSSPNKIPPLMQCLISSVTIGKTEALTLIRVCQYEHERNIFLLMTCNIDCIILFKSQLSRTDRWCLGIIDRFNRTEDNLDWHDGLIISIGFIDKNNIYIFTERDFLIYSLNPFSKLYSFELSHSDTNSLESVDLQSGIGTVDNKYIYHIHFNSKFHWILSIVELEKRNYVSHYDLTEHFPDIKRFIHICIDNQTINFLVEMDGSQYAVIFCSINTLTSIESKGLIRLSYAENPLTICSLFIPYLQKYLFFINDPAAKIIHILNHEKYLQSYPLIAYALCYIEESDELMITSTDAVFSIHLNNQNIFFERFSYK